MDQVVLWLLSFVLYTAFIPRVGCHPQRSYECTRGETLHPVSLLLPWHRTLLWSVDRRRQERLGAASILHPWCGDVVSERCC